MNPLNRKISDYIFCVLIGALLLYAVNSAILVTTIVETTPLRLFLTGFVMLVILMAVFYNRATLIAAGIFLALAALYLWATWERWEDQRAFIAELALAARGMFALEEEHYRAVVTAVCGATAFFTVLFLYVNFNFFILALGGGAIFAISWLMKYRQDDSFFVLYLFCFIMLLIKFMSKPRNKADFSSLNALLALPLCLLALFVGSFAPGQGDGGADNPLRTLLDKPLNAVNEVFYLAFNPKYFTFQSTGFSNAPDRLGGSISLNNREVMYVTAPNRTYLSGAVKNIYTGENWEDGIERGLPTSVYNPGRFEFLETAAALVRGTTQYDTSEFFFEAIDDRLQILRQNFPEEDRPFITDTNMPRLITDNLMSIVGFYPQEHYTAIGFFESVRAEEEEVREKIAELQRRLPRSLGVELVAIKPELSYIRSYLPLEAVTVSPIGRTGTLFRPGKGWDPQMTPGSVTSNADLSAVPSGDWQARNLLDEGEAYSFPYLAPNTRLTVVTDILNSARRGYYAEHPVDSEVIYEYFSELADPATVSAHFNRSTGDKAAVLFNALYQTYLYTTEAASLMPPGAGMTAGGWAGETKPITDEAFTYASTAINNPLAQYANTVYAHYTALPEGLPRRVYDLAEEITGGLDTDYEKVKAIEAYLLTFPYTLDPGPVPDGADFVDYFLFEGKKGYCTYYASAMAVLARCVGVPSRYAEGFLLPPDRNANGVYVVTNEQAHTWAEVYLEGYGWLQLEPTAPYNAAAAGNTSGISPGLFAGDYASAPGYEEHLRNMGFTDGAIDMTLPENPPPPPPVVKEPFEFTFATALYIIGAVSTAFALVLLYIGLQRLRETLRRRKVNKMPVNEQAQAYFKGLIRITGYYHYPLRAGETAQMYGKRLGKRFAFKSDTVFLRDLITIYYAARFGEKSITNEELALVRDCYQDMVAFLRMVRKLPRYIVLRYFRRVTAL